MHLSRSSDPICLSGGAEGADIAFGTIASSRGHEVFHFSFDGHRTRAPLHQVVTLDDTLLREADPHLEKANATLKRRFSTVVSVRVKPSS